MCQEKSNHSVWLTQRIRSDLCKKLNFNLNQKEVASNQNILVMKIGKTHRNFENIFDASSEIVVSPCSTQACLVAPVTPGQTMLR